jgi:hypothetical protein
MDKTVAGLLLFCPEDGGSKSFRKIGKIYQAIRHCKREHLQNSHREILKFH